MELTPVKSSHIAAIGYLEAERILLVKPANHDRAAQHPGKLLRDVVRPQDWILIQKGVMPTEPARDAIPVVWPAGNDVTPAGPLNVLDEEISGCCRRSLLKALETDAIKRYIETGGRSLQCTECKQEYQGQEVGPMIHWRFRPAYAIVRKP